MNLYRVMFTTADGRQADCEVMAGTFKSAVKQGERWNEGNKVTELWIWRESTRSWHVVNLTWSFKKGRVWVAEWAIV